MARGPGYAGVHSSPNCTFRLRRWGTAEQAARRGRQGSRRSASRAHARARCRAGANVQRSISPQQRRAATCALRPGSWRGRALERLDPWLGGGQQPAAVWVQRRLHVGAGGKGGAFRCPADLKRRRSGRGQWACAAGARPGTRPALQGRAHVEPARKATGRPLQACAAPSGKPPQALPGAGAGAGQPASWQAAAKRPTRRLTLAAAAAATSCTYCCSLFRGAGVVTSSRVALNSTSSGESFSSLAGRRGVAPGRRARRCVAGARVQLASASSAGAAGTALHPSPSRPVPRAPLTCAPPRPLGRPCPSRAGRAGRGPQCW